MPEVDPVILQLRADVNQYLGTLRTTTTKVDQLLGQQEKRTKQLEREFARSSGAISGHLKGLAGTLATFVTGRELVGLIDGFTRLQNELRVSGLEGKNLADVQERLFQIGNKYGVAINDLAGLYGKSAQAGRELGATQAQLLQLTEETSQALLITGTSSQQSAGAILGLTQALAAGTVRAEEFNQINEGGLRPLLQAAAASARWGGSVAKLRADILAGKVSSQELFAAILAGAELLRGQASSSTLTLSGAFTALNNKLIEYVGGAASANGATGALAAGIQALANNLETIIPALAVIAAVIGTRYVAAAFAAIGATAAFSAALFALQARMVGAATTAEALAFAGRGVAGAFGGPVTLAILAAAAGIYGLTQYTKGADQATGAFAKVAGEADSASTKLAAAVETLANAHGKARVEALAQARAEAENVKQKLASARASIALAQAELARAKSLAAAQDVAAASAGGTVPGATGGIMRLTGIRGVNTAQTNLSAMEQAAAKLEKDLKSAGAIISGVSAPKVAAVGTPTKGAKATGGGASGPSAAETAQRYEDQLTQITQRILGAMEQQADNADDRADLQLKQLEFERIAVKQEINRDKNYSAAQKADLLAANERLADRGREQVEHERRVAIERDATDMAAVENRAQADALGLQLDLADTQAERKRIALDMLDLEERYQRSLLEGVLASEAATEAEKERARVALAALAEASAAKRESVSRANETATERYLRDLDKRPDQINEAIDGIKIDGLEALNDGLVDAITGAKSLGDVFHDVSRQIIADLLRIAIQQAVIKPLAEALFGGASGGGGLLGGIFGAIGGGIGGGTSAGGGRASGGYVSPGRWHRVNEGASPGRVEAFMSRDGGSIIPLGRMSALNTRGPTIVQPIIHVDARGAVMNDQFARMILSQANDHANQVGAQSYRQSIKDAPGAVQNARRYGRG